MQTRIDEIAAGIYRLSVHVPDAALRFRFCPGVYSRGVGGGGGLK